MVFQPLNMLVVILIEFSSFFTMSDRNPSEQIMCYVTSISAKVLAINIIQGSYSLLL